MKPILRHTYFIEFQVNVTVTAPSRRPINVRVLDVAERPELYRIEFTPTEVGTHLIDVSKLLSIQFMKDFSFPLFYL